MPFAGKCKSYAAPKNGNNALLNFILVFEMVQMMSDYKTILV